MKNRRVPDRFGTGKSATHNAMGFRALTEYSARAATGKHRVVFLGDSFTYGIDAGDADTYVAKLASMAPSIEAVNMGVPAYGIDQMYLAYRRRGQQLAPDLVLLAFIADDFRRMRMTVFQTQYPKPRLSLRGDKLRVSNVPVPSWGVSGPGGWFRNFPHKTALVRIGRAIFEMYVHPYDPYPVAEHIFAELNRLALRNDQRFVLVYLPSEVDFERDRNNDVPIRVAEIAARNHIPFFNLTKSLGAVARDGSPVFGGDGRHYSEAGYKAVATILLENLRTEFPPYFDTDKAAKESPRR